MQTDLHSQPIQLARTSRSCSGVRMRKSTSRFCKSVILGDISSFGAAIVLGAVSETGDEGETVEAPDTIFSGWSDCFPTYVFPYSCSRSIGMSSIGEARKGSALIEVASVSRVCCSNAFCVFALTSLL